MPKVVVTGGSGRLGTAVLEHFLESGYEVVNADLVKPKVAKVKHVTVNLQNLGECYGALAGADAVVHLAAIPVAYSHPNEVTFQNNVMSTYNILQAAAGLGIGKAVVASSESSYGIVFAKHRLVPQYVPLDEDHPQLPQDSYGLSKIVNEKTAEMFHRLTGMQVVSFRIGNVIAPEMYQNFPNFIHDPEQRQNILWSYIDARDAAVACRMAIEADGLGAVTLNLAADDTSMDIRSETLLSIGYPEVTDIRAPLDNFNTLLSNRKIKEVLNWRPVHSWRDHVKL
ncbi:nucleoside-diphosphate-sugar epimerase [Hydrogenispora ethanolica]|uniref:Nucleoside-diphosphate-sugar epimerase n=1 Tax=Hydrogenispora ethanolica TaxID=1082276 RepID=A0A4V2QG20_HYDET|nr:NAD(P)-dependent oxidoreductase [Hydrogenispora ethanolica]TCL74127.1 nucleoside-diphosphate-sugar epimerase [Hydrogenispora ethanolica]